MWLDWRELVTRVAPVAHPERPVAFTLYLVLLGLLMWSMLEVSPLLAVLVWGGCCAWLFRRLKRLHQYLSSLNSR